MSNPSFKPALILHGGAGNIHRSKLPPDLYKKYHASLTSYLRSTRDMLYNGGSALDAAVHAVALMEDDELFNCGRGSVFTSAGTIEMEASVMVTSLQHPEGGEREEEGEIKRGAGVMGLKNVRNPIKLAREALLRTGIDSSGEHRDDGGSMHSQLVAPYVEELAKEWGLEFKPDEWFWTKRRWDEHRRGLHGTGQELYSETQQQVSGESGPVIDEVPSQGTVGCVCLDQWGNLAVATSTGGMTNKWPGRVGDTPTLGAGFWAEEWETSNPYSNAEPDGKEVKGGGVMSFVSEIRSLLGDCLPPVFRSAAMSYTPIPAAPVNAYTDEKQSLAYRSSSKVASRRAAAVSGTGNGDSFLRTAAARTACAMLRFSSPSSNPCNLAEAVTAVVGPGGELQRSAGKRWGKTGEGEGGMIGIEAEADCDKSDGEKQLRKGKVVFDFNSNGMWRAWVEEDANGRDRERVMVFREEYH
ncbi:Asparaginase [Aspergillus sclerotialis]|uniref:Asparaginase n=1 Tax=Aspergillus sclerotialis TaxID=2070753 RepID=A0A3A2Z5X0_9EURO|nr:Asparaginase [Aspergillus sclerotialis]